MTCAKTAIFARHLKLIWVVQPACEKYCACAVGQISCTCLRVLHSQEGRFAIVTDVERGMRWTHRHQLTSDADADGEVVWSWLPDAGAKLVRSKLLLRGDGGYQSPAHRGDHEGNRNTIAQGVPDCFGGPVVTNSCVFYLHTRLRVRKTPGIPCALYPLRDTNDASLGRDRSARMQCRIQSVGWAKARLRAVPTSCPSDS